MPYAPGSRLLHRLSRSVVAKECQGLRRRTRWNSSYRRFLHLSRGPHGLQREVDHQIPSRVHSGDVTWPNDTRRIRLLHQRRALDPISLGKKTPFVDGTIHIARVGQMNDAPAWPRLASHRAGLDMDRAATERTRPDRLDPPSHDLQRGYGEGVGVERAVTRFEQS